ncbi:unnamed protein product, partial [Adineta steineri]
TRDCNFIKRPTTTKIFKKPIAGVPNGGSSERIINPSPLSFITAPVNGIQLQCLLDTGASNTFIHTSTLSKIRHNPIKRIKGTYTLADGNTAVDIDGEA